MGVEYSRIFDDDDDDDNVVIVVIVVSSDDDDDDDDDGDDVEDISKSEGVCFCNHDTNNNAVCCFAS
jgi:hypothetical protein